MRALLRQLVFGIVFVTLMFTMSCALHGPNLVPDEPSAAPNYWCTWYWQNYLIRQGVPIDSPADFDPHAHLSNPAAREELTWGSILGENGMARVLLPESRGDYYFLIDHGWQDTSIKQNTFFTLIMDTRDFPAYAGLEPKERIKRLNDELKDLGWRGLGLWVRGTPSEADTRKFVEWSKYAGVEYWKIDGGDTAQFRSFKAKQAIYPELILEYVTGSGGPLNAGWHDPHRGTYPSVYAPGVKQVKDANAGPGLASRALTVMENCDVFRTYDAVPLLVTTVSLQRVYDILLQTAGKPQYRALLNVQDDTNLAAALGCVVAVKRHPMINARMYQGRDIHFQIAGDRHVENRLNEMDRFVRWQRIAPPMPAGYGTYLASEKHLIDQIEFRPGDTWKKDTWGKMVTQSAPAIMARNLPLPEVEIDGEPPYVMAGRFPNGAVCIATEGRVKPGCSWYHPRADISLTIGDAKGPIGVFGHYRSLTLNLDRSVPKNTKVWAQDLLADKAIDITDKVQISGNKVTIPGELTDQIGTSANKPGDISTPGLVIQMQTDAVLD